MSDRQFVHKHDEVQLARIVRESKPWFDQYGTTLIYGLAAVLAAAALVVYFARKPPATADASRGLLLASSAEDYRAVADESPDSPLGIVARLKQAELSLNTAISDLFSNREVALTELKAAETALDLLAGRSDLTHDCRLRVLAGQARAAEARCDGTDASVDATVAAWKKVLDFDPNSTMFKDLAEERIKNLPLESTKSFYAWFQKQDPKPNDDLTLPQDGPGVIPDIPRIDSGFLNDPFMAPTGPNTTPSVPADATSPATTPDPGGSTTPGESTPPTPPGESTPAVDPGAPAVDPAAPVTEPAATGTEPTGSEPAATEPLSIPPAADAPATAPPAAPEKSGE